MHRILFVAEAVSLAHAARPYVLAKSLDPGRFEVHFAMAKRYPLAFDGSSVRSWPIHSIAPEEFLSSLAAGRPIYRYEVLANYVEEDLALLDAVRPDVVVGDFRLSLAVSARLRGVHYMALANAHWSPYSSLDRMPFPEHRLGALIGVGLAGRLFNLAEPLVLARHAAPLNRLRRAYGQKALSGLREVYTTGDTTLYADVPELVPMRGLPDTHTFIGPILWSPEVSKPGWWSELSPEETCIYVTLGSSGQVRALPAVLQGLSRLPVTVLLATAGREMTGELPPNVRSSDYLPGIEAARRSALVVCNGGSATVYQALAEGKPVLGIASNLDQHLTMAFVARAGAGLTIRAEQAKAPGVREFAERLLAEPGFAANARKVARWFAAYRAPARFREALERALRSKKKGG